MNYQRNYVQNLVNGFMSTMVIYAGCELGIFDVLKSEKKTVEELSQYLGITSSDLLRLLRPLEQYKLLKIEGREITLSDSGRILTADDSDSLKPYALFCGRESLKAWSCIYPALKEKVRPIELMNQLGIFHDMEENSERFQTFNGMMSSVSKQMNLNEFFRAFLGKNEAIKIADVGGGTGSIIQKFLEYYQNAVGVILDLPQAKESALENLKKANLDKRCAFEETDFFQKIKTEADVYILSRVLHDWQDSEAEEILKNVADSMGEDSYLVVLEEIIRQADEPNAMRSYMNDIQMWVLCDGKERTLQEFSSLFEKVGLKIQQVFDTEEGTAVIIVVKDNEEMGEI